jgi:hypothetical protein
MVTPVFFTFLSSPNGHKLIFQGIFNAAGIELFDVLLDHPARGETGGRAFNDFLHMIQGKCLYPLIFFNVPFASIPWSWPSSRCS